MDVGARKFSTAEVPAMGSPVSHTGGGGDAGTDADREVAVVGNSERHAADGSGDDMCFNCLAQRGRRRPQERPETEFRGRLLRRSGGELLELSSLSEVVM